jgi:hypothetical protein
MFGKGCSEPLPTTSPTSYARWPCRHWSLTTLREKLVKIGARIMRHGRYVVFQLAEVAVPRVLFAEILRRVDRLRPRPRRSRHEHGAQRINGNTAGEVRPRSSKNRTRLPSPRNSVPSMLDPS